MEVSPRIRRDDVLEVAVRVAGEVRSLRALTISGNARKWVVEGSGNPLQYSCLENSMDRRAWQATVYRVAELDTTKQLATKEVSGKSREDAGSAVDEPILEPWSQQMWTNLEKRAWLSGEGGGSWVLWGSENEGCMEKFVLLVVDAEFRE